MNIFRRKKLTRIEKNVKKHKVILYHDTGTDVTLEDVTEESLRYIRNNLGRDVIYAQDDTYINLGKFAIAIINSNNQK